MANINDLQPTDYATPGGTGVNINALHPSDYSDVSQQGGGWGQTALDVGKTVGGAAEKALGFLGTPLMGAAKTLILKPQTRFLQALTTGAGAMGLVSPETVARANGPLTIGQGTPFEQTVEPQKNFGQGGAAQIGSDAIQSAAYLATPYGSINKGATSVASKFLPKAVARVAGSTATGAAGGYQFDVASNLDQGKKGAAVLTPGMNTAIGAVVGGVPEAYQVGREKLQTSAVKDLTDKYTQALTARIKGRNFVDTSTSRGLSPAEVLASKGRDVLPTVDKNMRFNTERGQEVLNDQVEKLGKIRQEALGASNKYVSLADVEADALKAANNPVNRREGTIPKIRKQIQDIFDNYRTQWQEVEPHRFENGQVTNDLVPVQELEQMRIGQDALGRKVYAQDSGTALTRDAHYQTRDAMSKAIDTRFENDGLYKDFTKHMQELINAREALEQLHGQVVNGGKLNRYFGRTAGIMLGHASGGGLFGELLGGVAGDQMAQQAAKNSMTTPIGRSILAAMEKEEPGIVQKMRSHTQSMTQQAAQTNTTPPSTSSMDSMVAPKYKNASTPGIFDNYQSPVQKMFSGKESQSTAPIKDIPAPPKNQLLLPARGQTSKLPGTFHVMPSEGAQVDYTGAQNSMIVPGKRVAGEGAKFERNPGENTADAPYVRQTPPMPEYEPYTPHDQLPTIKLGPKAKSKFQRVDSNLPTIKPGAKSPRSFGERGISSGKVVVGTSAATLAAFPAADAIRNIVKGKTYYNNSVDTKTAGSTPSTPQQKPTPKTAPAQSTQSGDTSAIYTPNTPEQKVFASKVLPKYADRIQAAAKQNGVPAQLVAKILNRENAVGDEKAVRKNTDGSVDTGLMQINSSMMPYMRRLKQIGAAFDAKNPDHAIQGAAAILADNTERLQAALKRPPKEKEIIASYNLGVNHTLKAIKGDPYYLKLAERYIRSKLNN